MTDRSADHPLDGDLPEVEPAFELASALHDGEGDEVDRARADEVVRGEARTVAAVSGRVADVPAPPAALVDDHVATALAAFDEEHGTGPAPAGGAQVTALAERRPWYQRLSLGAVAAAVAVVALVGAIGVAAVGDDADGDDTATGALESADTGAPAEEDAEAFTTDGAAAGGTSITGAERESFASYDELAGALAERTSERATTEAQAEDEATAAAPAPVEPSAGSTGAAGCDAIGAAGIDPARVELVLPVVVGDQLVTAVVHRTDEGRRVTAVDEATCVVADDRSL